MSKDIVVTIPADADYIDIVRLTLYGIASRMGFSYEEIEDMKVAVSEACNNAIIHGYEGNASDILEIRFKMKHDSIDIKIKDKGSSFNYKETVKNVGPIPDQAIKDIKEGELGIYLMQSLMDHIEVISEVGMGTEVTLTKALKRE